MAWFIPVAKQLRKCISQSTELFGFCSDQLCQLIYEFWAESSKKKVTVSGGGFVSWKCISYEHIQS